MNFLMQLRAMLRMNVRTFSDRFKPALVIFLGVAAVVVVLLLALSSVEGIKIAYQGAGDRNEAMFLSAPAFYEGQSTANRTVSNLWLRRPKQVFARAADPASGADSSRHRS